MPLRIILKIFLTLWVHCKGPPEPLNHTLRLTGLRNQIVELMVVAAAVSGEWDVGRSKYRILHSLGKGFICLRLPWWLR